MFLLKNGYQNQSQSIIQRIDWKSVLVVFLFILVFILGGIWFFQSTGNKEELNRLHTENSQLIKERKAIEHTIDSLQKIQVKLEDSKTELENRVDESTHIIDSLKKKSVVSKVGIDKAEQERSKIEQQIQELKKNPKNRTGEDLEKSLKEKFKSTK